MFCTHIRYDSSTSQEEGLHLLVDATLVSLQGSRPVLLVNSEKIVLSVVADAPRRLGLALTKVKGCDAGRLGKCTFVGTLTSCFNVFETEQAFVFCTGKTRL